MVSQKNGRAVFHQADYEGELGDNDPQEVRQLPAAPFSIARLNDIKLQSFGSHQHMQESVQEGIVRRWMEGLASENIPSNEEDDNVSIEVDDNKAIYLHTLPYDDFRNRLVEHFTILFKKNKVKWPQRGHNN
jgi:hypothetical protein